ncbi:MAG: d(CMP) kinase [Proteobacteria bacterium]|jgi:cytidylate kinase|nr:d(CMP) kinase [Pseudomonadota bacterium]MDA1237568.1 d(CMP) kinase [Pseudomonadota bacterium]
MKFTVAIDGPAASGKGTISKRIANFFKFSYLDTGMIYRVIGLKTLTGLEPLDAVAGLNENDFNLPNLRNEEVSKAASMVAKNPAVREALLEYQRHFSRREGGAVLDGRDIGTVICPAADIKFFVTASEEVRAKRRFKELSLRNNGIVFETVLADLKSRDQEDTDRATSPLRMSADAVLLDTTKLSIDASVETAIEVISSVYK